MQFSFEGKEFETFIRQVVSEVLAAIDWPAGRIALDEGEAAEACGVGRHVLRDLRLSGKITARRVGKKVLYTRKDLLAALGVIETASEATCGAPATRARSSPIVRR